MKSVSISMKASRRSITPMRLKNTCQLQDLSIREYLIDKYALWHDFRTIDENALRGIGRRIQNTSEVITLQIEKKLHIYI